MKDSSNSGDIYVYSPDVKSYATGDKSSVSGAFISLFVGPVRLLRVLHNIVILPDSLLASYASSLLFTGLVMLALGTIDYLVFRRWPLFISQIPVILIALWLKRKASHMQELEEKKREIEIDTDQIEELCESVYTELDEVVGKDVSSNG